MGADRDLPNNIMHPTRPDRCLLSGKASGRVMMSVRPASHGKKCFKAMLVLSSLLKVKKPITGCFMRPRMKKNSVISSALFSVLIAFSPLAAQAVPSHNHPSRLDGNNEIQLAQNTQQDLPFLSPGSRGQAVLVLQIALKQLGFYSGLLDGVYEDGFLLFKAVRKFQSSNGIPADGVVGPGTWKSILSKWTSR